ncbi:IS110 family transposase [soil metagenome]
MKKKESKQRKEEFQVVNPRAAGIDIASMEHFVAVPERLEAQPVRHLGAFTRDLEALADWLVSVGITTVAMESTGNYWLSLYEVLEARGLEVCLVNARHMKNVSGRKSDVQDCQWLQQLHTFGLLKACFIPGETVRRLRCYVRQRNAVEQQKGRDLQHLQRSLTDMNLKLHHLVSDLEGVAAMRIVEEIAAGVTDARQLARHRNKAMKATEEELVRSLEGNYTAEHLFTLNQALSSYRFHVGQMRECDEQIERLLSAMSGTEQQQGEEFCSRGKARKARKNQYRFDLRSYLLELLGVDLTQVEGLEENTVLEVIAETGTDLGKWATAKHLASWLGLCPNPAKSGGKVLGHKQRGGRSSSRAAKAFRLAARSLHASGHYLGGLYRRVSHKKGPKAAIKAVARKLAVIFYTMVRNKADYVPLEAKEYEERTKARIIKNLRRKAQALGLELREMASGQHADNVMVV